MDGEWQSKLGDQDSGNLWARLPRRTSVKQQKTLSELYFSASIKINKATPAPRQDRKEKERMRSQQVVMIKVESNQENKSMPHCSKCGKMPQLGIKRLFKALGKLLQSFFASMRTRLKAAMNRR